MFADTMLLVFLLLSGVLAGVLFSVEIAVLPMLGKLSGEQFTRIHRLLDPGFDPLMPRMSKVALAAGALAAVFTPSAAATLLLGGAVAAVIAVAVVSELYNVRMNRDIDTWDSLRPPRSWARTRARWGRFNRVRTCLAVSAFVLAAAAALFG